MKSQRSNDSGPAKDPEPSATANLPGLVDSGKFAAAQSSLSGVVSCEFLPRLDVSLVGPEGQLTWQFVGRSSRTADSRSQNWLDLKAHLHVHLPCARCDEPVETQINLERSFLFAANERVAEVLDDQAEDYDVLVDDKRFSLSELLEDECVMALPSFVIHETCEPVVADDAEEPARNPFAALAGLRRG